MKALSLLWERVKRSAIDAQTVGTERKQGTACVRPLIDQPLWWAKTVLGTAEMSLPLKPWRRWWMAIASEKPLILFFSTQVRIQQTRLSAMIAPSKWHDAVIKTGKQRKAFR